MLFIVYISSTSEFQQIRQDIISEIKKRPKLYQVNSMEDYTAENLPAVVRCREDVDKCHIYVCIWGSQYGTVVNDGKGMSFTHHEFDEATIKGKPTLIFLKNFPKESGIQDNHPNLVKLKNEISNEKQLLTKKFSNDKELPDFISAALDNYVASLQKDKTEGKNYTKVLLCNREEINQDLHFSVNKNKNPVQFYMLKGHEKDLPGYFVERQKIEDADQDIRSDDIRITPFFGDNIDTYEDAEEIIKAQIALKLKWKKQWGEIAPETIIQYMDGKCDNLFVVWIIEVGVWRNEKLKNYILQFCKKFGTNSASNTNKRILFFGILRHAEESGITLEQFYKLIGDISWDKNLLLTKITKTNVKDWLEENDIASVNATADYLIQSYLNDIAENPLHFSEVENGLRKMIDHYDQNNS